ncbi:MAG: protein kinase [Deltaproteobacteria bacterium]|nr:protein kinase [Deltaproteobacteria bacterium]
MLAMDGSVISGRFSLEERLPDQGRFEVHRGIELSSRRRVVIRFLPAAESVARTEIEKAARAMMRLPHPGIVPVLDVGAHLGRPFLVTPTVEGTTLAQLLARPEPVAMTDALRILAQVGEALEHAHKGGVVHGALSPASIMIAREGRALLTDCGFAHWIELVTSNRPSSIPPPLPSITADLEALRHLAHQLIGEKRTSMAPGPAGTSVAPGPATTSPGARPGGPPPPPAASVPPMRHSAPPMRSSAPPVQPTPPLVALAASQTPPPTPSVPSAPVLAGAAPGSLPPVRPNQRISMPIQVARAPTTASEMLTEIAEIVEPEAAKARPPALKSSAVKEDRTLIDGTIPMRVLPPETLDADPVIISNDAGEAGGIDERLVPKQILLARRALAWSKTQLQREELRGLRQKIGPAARRAQALGKEWLARAIELWHRLDRPEPAEGEEPSLMELEAAGVTRWQRLSLAQRAIVVAGAAVLLLIVISWLGGSSPTSTSKNGARVEAVQAAPAPALVAPQGPEKEKKKSNVELLREGKLR